MRFRTFGNVYHLLRFWKGLSCWLFSTCLIYAQMSVAAAQEPIRIGMVADYYPFHYLDEGGQPSGILVETWELWSEKTGKAVDFVPGTWEESLSRLESGAIDLHIGICKSDTSYPGVAFGPVLQPSEFQVFHRDSLFNVIEVSDLKAFQVGVIAGDFAQHFLEEKIGANNIVPFVNYSAMMEAFAKEEVRVIVGETTTVLHHLETYGVRDKTRYNPIRPLIIQSYRAGVAEENAGLLDDIQAGMRQISGAERGEIESKWLGNLTLTGLDTLKVGFSHDFAPLTYLSGDGQPTGLLIDLWKKWGEKTGKQIVFQGGAWEEILQGLVDYEIDIVAGLAYSEGRSDFMDFSSPFYQVDARLYAMTDGDPVETLIESGDLEVGVLQGSFYDEVIRDEYPNLTTVKYPTHDLLAGALNSGEIRAALAPSVIFDATTIRLGLANSIAQGKSLLYRSSLHAAVLKGREELMELIEEGLAEISNNEWVTMEALWIRDNEHRHYLPRSEGLQLTDEEKRWLASNTFILHSGDPAYHPVEFLNDRGEPAGMVMEYLDLIKQRLGVNMEFVQVDSWSEALQLGKDREIDLLPAMASNKEREEYFLFTEAFLDLPTMVFVRSNSNNLQNIRDLYGKRVAAMRDYAETDALGIDHPEIEVVLVDDLATALRRVSVGELDGVISNLATASYEINRLKITNLRLVGETGFTTHLAMAVRKDWPLLHSVLNKALASVTPEEKEAIERQWITIESNSWKPSQEFVLGVLAVIFLMVFTLYWNRKLSFEVSQRKRAEKAVREIEERQTFALQAAEEGVWDYDLSDNTVHFSSRYWEMLGYDPAEMEPAGVESFQQLLHPDDKRAFNDAIPSYFHNRPEGWTLEFRLLAKNGKYRWILSRGLVAAQDERGNPRRVVGTHLDVTERKLAEEAVRVSEQRIRSMGDNLVDGCIYQLSMEEGDDISRAGRIDYVSAGLKNLVGIDPDELQKNPMLWYTRIHPDDVEEYQHRQVDAIRRETVFRAEVRIKTKEDVFKWIHFRSSPRRDSTGKLVFDGLMLDISDRKEAEARFKAAKEEADLANRAKGEFLANMSHEIRTPMNAILGMSHLVIQTDLNSKQYDYIHKIQSSANRLLGIINDILDFSKIEAGRLEIERVEFNLEDVLSDLSNLVSLKAEEKNLELVFKVSREVPTLLKGDPLRLGQILINLTNNAIKFTDVGEIVVSITKTPQPVQNGAATALLKFTVRDSGIGMTEEQLRRLFQSFSQADTSITRRYGGTGLGLVISKRLVEMMGGDIRVESKHGVGSRFMFTVPLAVVGQDKRPQPQAPKDLSGSRILVIDDNTTAQEYIRDLLKHMSFQVSLAGSGEEALRLFTEQDNIPYDLVLIDFKMPGLNGIETATHLKAAMGSQQIPIILMVSSYGREEVTKSASAAGIDGFLIKPLTASLVLDSIMEVFGRAISSRKEVPIEITGDDEDLIHIQGARLLLVEDNEINQQVAVELLEGAGLVLVVAANGQEALDILKREKGDFDAILMDLQMPVMDGYLATAHIRNNQEWDSIPIIAMTAHVMEADRQRCLDAGMNDHVGKPIDPQELNTILLKWIKEGRATTDHLSSVTPALFLQKSKDLVLPNQIKGISLDEGLGKIGGNRPLFRRLLLQFKKEYQSYHTKLKDSYYSGDRETAYRMAHTIKGVSGNIGAMKVHEEASALERCIQEENHAQFPKYYSAFSRALEELMEGLKTLGGERSSVTPAPFRIKEVDSGAVAPIFRSLLHLVENNSMDADKELDSLKEQLEATRFEDIALKLEDKLNEFDFEGAREILVSLAQELNLPTESANKHGR